MLYGMDRYVILPLPDYTGAVDGTHIHVKVPKEYANYYNRRKQLPTQNVLAACDFGINFTYVLTGWKGTTFDSKVLKIVLSMVDKLKLPEENKMLKAKWSSLDAGTFTLVTLRWTKQMDSCLLELMLDLHTRGNFINGQLSTTGYHKVVNTLRVVFGLSIKNDNINNRLKTLKDHFGKCYDLFNS